MSAHQRQIRVWKQEKEAPMSETEEEDTENLRERMEEKNGEDEEVLVEKDKSYRGRKGRKTRICSHE